MKLFMLSQKITFVMFTFGIFALASLMPLSGQKSSEPISNKEKPTIILVHGAFADGSSWSKVIPILQKQGYNTISVQNPLTSLTDDVSFVNRAIAEVNGPVVLVGHSWAGVVITEAGNDPKVKSLVYVAAYAPDTNESALGLTKDAHEVRKLPAVPGLDNPIITDGYIRLREETVIKHFAQDLPESEAKVVAAVQGRFHTSTLTATVSKPAWKTKPSFYVVADNDHIISPLMEQEMAKKIGAETYHVKSSHVAMLARPEEVSKIIIKAAQK